MDALGVLLGGAVGAGLSALLGRTREDRAEPSALADELNWAFLIDGKPGVPLATATAGFRVTGYPVSALDMVYLDPPLARADGRSINALSTTTIDGRTFQQWSRHYPFQPGIDSFTSHFRAAQNCIEKAVRL